jgi:hypothetical protein
MYRVMNLVTENQSLLPIPLALHQTACGSGREWTYHGGSYIRTETSSQCLYLLHNYYAGISLEV